ncbi:class I SAM-dependent methyltransferase [Kitasatospora sp. NPDC058218]|uniref:class I SAM-dependent methyltransferase n=1 Tax=Kitasatospora sp. NPDC058218 TaxID=3346385 RepID=UPI0036DC3DFF
MALDLALTQVSQLAFGYWHSQVLIAAVELSVFDALADGPLSAEEVAERCAVPADSALRLLDAATALRLLTRGADGGYGNSRTAERLLTTGSPESLVRWVRVMGRWYQPWGRLGQALELGRAVEDRSERLTDDPAYVEDFILGMHEYNSRTAEAVARALPAEDARRLIDVGGGAGSYSIAFCRVWEGLRAEVVDLAPVVELAGKVIGEAGLADRITARTGDYYQDAFGTDADVVLLSNVLHQESPENCLSILGRSAAALRPGGRVLVHGHFLEESRTAPVFTTLHNLSALALWSGGRSYTTDEMAELMTAAGLSDIEVLPTAEQSARLLVGRTAGTPGTAG